MSTIPGWDDSRCCCHSPDARDCFRSRHPAHPPLDDEDNWDDDDTCECACHNDYTEFQLDMEDANL